MTPSPAAVETVSVALGDRSYDILIGDGLLESAGARLAPLLPRKRTVVVTDENVWSAQGGRLDAGLRGAGLEFETVVLPPGERTKSFAHLERLTDRLLDLGVERDDMILAFGGGVVGDIAGFAAAILRRGCRFAQIPTSLLAQVDSAVGGKTGVNAAAGKNLVGAFHQPAIVLADTRALDTLSERHRRAGYAEIVKYGAINNRDFFAWLEDNGAGVIDGDAARRIRAVRACCEAKAAIVAADECEAGARALLNLGHTFGHALEAHYNYGDQLLHGEAVAIGMALAFRYSARLGLCDGAEAERLQSHLRAVGLPMRLADLPQARDLDGTRLAARMRQDKKMRAGRLTLVLADGIGGARLYQDASLDDLAAFLNEEIAAGGAHPA